MTGEKLPVWILASYDVPTEFRIKKSSLRTSGGGGRMNTFYSFVTNKK